MIKEQMDKIYGSMHPDEIPWNMKDPPGILREIVTRGRVKPCKAVELGCGAGNYVVYLAQNGFDTTGIDISETAVGMARKLASEKGLDCNFITADIRGDMTELADTFDFAYDWEVMHHIFPEDRQAYISNVYTLLKPEGVYLSVCFSEESPQFGGKGKYRTTPLETVLYFSSEAEMEKLFKPLFEIQVLNTVDVQGKFGIHKAIYALLKKY
ncbi:MAG: class I SAM-dependent methyltransferase [Nitrospiraceae bacterium]|nr:MAG: class I SAM-dependent methyltransferase [Nitrospiraceae bacterium]